MTKDNFPIGGMSCAACATRVEKVLNGCEGVKHAAVNFANATAGVEYDASVVTPESLQQVVRDAGYELFLDATTEKLESEQAKVYRKLKRNTVWAILLSLPVVIIGMFFMHIPYANLIMFLFSTPVVFIFGSRFFVGAWKQLLHKSSNMDTLVALSTGIAWTFSVANMLWPEWWESHGIHPHVYFEAAAVIIAFILLGRTMESKAKGNTSSAIKKLMGLQPKTVTAVMPDGSLHQMPVEDIKPGDTIIVRPGERVAVDGIVTEGSSYIDESMLSGEPIPVEKKVDAKVFAGTINGTGTFRFRADKTGGDTLLAKIIRMVQDAQGSKAPVQQLVDKVAAVFVPVIICISIVTFIVWMLCDSEGGFSHGLLAAVTVLVIACPCALGLATPTAIMVGIGKGAESGILIKDAEALEIAPKINAVVLDKTGTLTEGKPVVANVIKFSREVPTDVLAAIETTSEHPLAQAVVERFKNSRPEEVTEFESITGRGVTAVYDGKRYYAGSRRLMEQFHIPVSEEADEAARNLTAEANSLVWFADSEGILALIGVTDPIKSTSAEAVSEFEKSGITVYMLTGDNRATAEAVARQAGISHVEAEVLPQEKSAFVEKLQSEGKRVAMVGDGINDSAALAVADLSIAMGTGSDIAIDVAKMTIISADLSRIPAAIRLSKATVRTIRQNLFWAFIYNLIGVPIAAGVLYPFNGFLLNPMIAGAAMACSSVSVVANSLLLKRKHFGESNRDNTPELTVTRNENLPEQKFKVEGMMCGHCTQTVSNAISGVPGVKEVDVDLATGTATVRGEVSAEAVIAAVEAADYKCEKL